MSDDIEDWIAPAQKRRLRLKGRCMDEDSSNIDSKGDTVLLRVFRSKGDETLFLLQQSDLGELMTQERISQLLGRGAYSQ